MADPRRGGLALMGLIALLLCTTHQPAQRRILHSARRAPRFAAPYVGAYSGIGHHRRHAYPVVVINDSLLAPWSYGSYLQGVANVIEATGQYYNQIQQARITRELS